MNLFSVRKWMDSIEAVESSKTLDENQEMRLLILSQANKQKNKQFPKCKNHKALTLLALVSHCYLEKIARNVIFPVGRASGFVRLDRLLQGKSRQSVLTRHCSVLTDPCRTQGVKRTVLALNILICWF